MVGSGKRAGASGLALQRKWSPVQVSKFRKERLAGKGDPASRSALICTCNRQEFMETVKLTPRQFYREAYQAITDFSFYRTIFTQPLRRSLVYLLYLAAHTAIVATLVYGFQDAPRLDSFLTWVKQSFPNMSVQKGRLTIDADQPLIKKFSQGKTPFTFIFDTTGAHRDAIGLDDPSLLFTRDRLYVKVRGHDETFNWSDLGDFRIDDAALETWAASVRWLAFPFVYSLALLTGLIGNPFWALCLTAFAWSASMRYGIRLRFSYYFTIALYALTPAVVIEMAVDLTGLTSPFIEGVYLAAAALYTYLATQRCVVIE